MDYLGNLYYAIAFNQLIGGDLIAFWTEDDCVVHEAVLINETVYDDTGNYPLEHWRQHVQSNAVEYDYTGAIGGSLVFNDALKEALEFVQLYIES